MHDDTFMNANKVFTGQLRMNKSEGLDVSKPVKSIDPADLAKLFKDYFIPGLERGDTEVLMHKVFFDICYYTGRHGKEGLKALTKHSFELKEPADWREFIEIEINFNETTNKKK